MSIGACRSRPFAIVRGTVALCHVPPNGYTITAKVGDTLNWRKDLDNIFDSSSKQVAHIDATTCPELTRLISAWQPPSQTVEGFEILGLLSEALLHAESIEMEPRVGEEADQLRARNALRAGARGYLFIGPDIGDAGLPTFAADIEALTGGSTDPRRIRTAAKSSRYRMMAACHGRCLLPGDVANPAIAYPMPDKKVGQKLRNAVRARLEDDVANLLNDAAAVNAFKVKYLEPSVQVPRPKSRSYSMSELAQILGIGVIVLHDWVRRGQLPPPDRNPDSESRVKWLFSSETAEEIFRILAPTGRPPRSPWPMWPPRET